MLVLFGNNDALFKGILGSDDNDKDDELDELLGPLLEELDEDEDELVEDGGGDVDTNAGSGGGVCGAADVSAGSGCCGSDDEGSSPCIILLSATDASSGSGPDVGFPTGSTGFAARSLFESGSVAASGTESLFESGSVAVSVTESLFESGSGSCFCAGDDTSDRASVGALLLP
ncbi:hypothetical protein AGMMS49990_10610 [Endomicrobiia bacterium]|nr:hypothetical protein AGMMS49990_10610 [Endomicrobiia bacterium]